MKISVLLLPFLVALSFQENDEEVDSEAKAVVLEADSKTTAAAAGGNTRLFTANPAVNGAVVGLGVGVIGSLLVGALLDNKDCNSRGRRDTPSARFLPGLSGPKKCPPRYNQQYNNGYQQPQTGYHQPQTGYHQPQTGYHQPQTGYQQPQTGYQQPQTGYNQPQTGYQQPHTGYNRPQTGYNQPQTGYNKPQTGYNQPQTGYNRPQTGYQQPQTGYNKPQTGYQQPQTGYNRPQSGYQQPSSTGYNRPQTGYTPAAPTPAFHPSNYPPSPSFHPGVPAAPLPIGYVSPNGRSLKKLATGVKPVAKDSSKVNFGK